MFHINYIISCFITKGDNTIGIISDLSFPQSLKSRLFYFVFILIHIFHPHFIRHRARDFRSQVFTPFLNFIKKFWFIKLLLHRSVFYGCGIYLQLIHLWTASKEAYTAVSKLLGETWQSMEV